ncbi:hypothetical protein CSIM01_06231 [Colletotrichum simmondsii]|uniref:F-box domain-containing protein n=1 Tax=Colletotrichum simmondsii TaxID=703756 RepID=A0A135SNG1_9PEZI|nr:hypothetical protein CSIM01_06231 [Colletotrichum simmondsii]
MDMNDKMELLNVRPLISLSSSYPVFQRLTRSAHPTQNRHLSLTTRKSRVCLQHQQETGTLRSPAELNLRKRITRRVEEAQQTLTITDLPPELHHSIIDFLDPIDSTCLGLASRYFYALHRRRHGTVHLSTRRPRPDDREWARRPVAALLTLESNNIKTAKTIVADPPDNATVTTLTYEQPIFLPQPRPPYWCEKCGLERCELQRHIRDWFPRDHEYCTISEKYVRLGLHREKEEFCHRRSPRNSSLCGKHHPRSVAKKVASEIIGLGDMTTAQLPKRMG